MRFVMGHVTTTGILDSTPTLLFGGQLLSHHCCGISEASLRENLFREKQTTRQTTERLKCEVLMSSGPPFTINVFFTISQCNNKILFKNNKFMTVPARPEGMYGWVIGDGLQDFSVSHRPLLI